MSSEQSSSTHSAVPTTPGISKVHACSKSDIGLKREENQDSFGVIEHERFRLYAVADGMGGVKGGAVASGIAIQTIKEAFSSECTADDTFLVDALVKANSLVFQEALSKPGLTGMGTTFVGLLFLGNDLYVANIGDSRAYLIRNGAVTQLTEDHTLVMELLRSGTISAEQAENHPVSHMLTRSLGPSPDVEVDCRRVEDGYREGDYYVLCSDGLYNLVSNYEIAEVLGSHSLDKAVSVLIDLANERGGTDNITVIAVQVGERVIDSAMQTSAAQVSRDGTSSSDAPAEGATESVLVDTVTTASTDHADLSLSNGHGGAVVVEDFVSEKIPSTATETPSASDQGAAAQNFIFGGGAAGSDGQVREASLSEQVSAAHVPPVEEGERSGRVERTIERSPFGYLLIIVAVLAVGLGGALIFSRNDDSSDDDIKVAAVSEPERQPQNDTRQSSSQVIADIIKPQEPPSILVDQNAAPPTNTKTGEESDAPAAQPGLLLDTTKEATQEQSSNTQGAKNSPSQAATLSTEQRTRIEKRIASLRARIIDLDTKIESFDKPVTGNVGKMLKDAQDRIEKHRQLLDEVKKSIDLATRKLAIWYQRRKQMKETDPINLAATVALVSEKVSVKYDSFKEVSAQYVREAESLNFNPNDQRQRDKVSELIALRRKRMTELGEEIRGAIEEEIAKADQHVAEFALQRDRVEQSLQRALRDVEYAKVVMGADKVAKQRMRDELIREHETAQAELEGLEQLVPTDGVHLFDSSLQSGLQGDNGVEP